MAPAKTLYVKEGDAPLWERFERAVADWQAADSVSALVTAAMRAYLDQFGDQGDGIYAPAPDDGEGIPPEGCSAVLERRGDGWFLTYDLDTSTPDVRLVTGPAAPMREALAGAREFLVGRREERRIAGAPTDDVRAELGAAQADLRDAASRLDRLASRALAEPSPYFDPGFEARARRFDRG